MRATFITQNKITVQMTNWSGVLRSITMVSCNQTFTVSDGHYVVTKISNLSLISNTATNLAVYFHVYNGHGQTCKLRARKEVAVDTTVSNRNLGPKWERSWVQLDLKWRNDIVLPLQQQPPTRKHVQPVILMFKHASSWSLHSLSVRWSHTVNTGSKPTEGKLL
jgi:hypothetical protein